MTAFMRITFTADIGRAFPPCYYNERKTIQSDDSLTSASVKIKMIP